MFYFAYGKYPGYIRWPLTVITAVLVFGLVIVAGLLLVAYNAVIKGLRFLPDPMEP